MRKFSFSKKKKIPRKLEDACRIKNVSLTQTVCKREFKPVKKLEKECGVDDWTVSEILSSMKPIKERQRQSRRRRSKVRSPKSPKSPKCQVIYINNCPPRRRSRKKVKKVSPVKAIVPFVRRRSIKRRSPNKISPLRVRAPLVRRRSPTIKTIDVENLTPLSPKKQPVLVYVVPSSKDGLFKPSEDLAFETIRKRVKEDSPLVKIRPSSGSRPLYDEKGKQLGYPIVSRYPLYKKGTKPTLDYDPISNMVLAEPIDKPLYNLVKTPTGSELEPFRKDDPNYRSSLRDMIQQQKMLDLEMDKEFDKYNQELDKLRRERERKRQEQEMLERAGRLKEAKQLEREIRENSAKEDILSRRKAKELRRAARSAWKAKKRELRADERARKYEERMKAKSQRAEIDDIYRAASGGASGGASGAASTRRPGTWKKIAKRLGMSGDTISTIMRNEPTKVMLRPRRQMVGMFSPEAKKQTEDDLNSIGEILRKPPSQLPLPIPPRPPPPRNIVPGQIQNIVRDYQTVTNVGKDVDQDVKNRLENLYKLLNELKNENAILKQRFEDLLRRLDDAKAKFEINPTFDNRNNYEKAEQKCKECYDNIMRNQDTYNKEAKGTADDLYKWAMFREFIDYLRQNNEQRRKSPDRPFNIPVNIGTTTEKSELNQAPKAEITLRDLDHLKELMHRDIEELRRTLTEQQALRNVEANLKRELQQERQRTPELARNDQRNPTDLEVKYAEVVDEMKKLIQQSNEQLKTLSENLKKAGEMQTTVQLADSAEMLDLMRQGNVQGKQLLELMKGIDTYNRAKENVPSIQQTIESPDVAALVKALEQLKSETPVVQNIDLEKLINALKQPKSPDPEMLALINALQAQKSQPITGEDIAKIIQSTQTSRGSTMTPDQIAELIKSTKSQTPVMGPTPRFSRSEIYQILDAIKSSAPKDRTDEILEALKQIQANPTNPQVVTAPQDPNIEKLVAELQRSNQQGVITKSDLQKVIDAIQSSAPKDRTGEILEALRALKTNNNQPQIIQVPTSTGAPQFIQVPAQGTPQFVQVPGATATSPTMPHTYPMMPNYPMMPSPAHFMGGGFYPPPPPYQPYSPNNDSSNLLLTILLMSMMGNGKGKLGIDFGMGDGGENDVELMGTMLESFKDLMNTMKQNQSGGQSGEKFKGYSAPKSFTSFWYEYKNKCKRTKQYLEDIINHEKDIEKQNKLKALMVKLQSNMKDEKECENILNEAIKISSNSCDDQVNEVQKKLDNVNDKLHKLLGDLNITYNENDDAFTLIDKLGPELSKKDQEKVTQLAKEKEDCQQTIAELASTKEELERVKSELNELKNQPKTPTKNKWQDIQQVYKTVNNAEKLQNLLNYLIDADNDTHDILNNVEQWELDNLINEQSISDLIDIYKQVCEPKQMNKKACENIKARIQEFVRELPNCTELTNGLDNFECKVQPIIPPTQLTQPEQPAQTELQQTGPSSSLTSTPSQTQNPETQKFINGPFTFINTQLRDGKTDEEVLTNMLTKLNEFINNPTKTPILNHEITTTNFDKIINPGNYPNLKNDHPNVYNWIVRIQNKDQYETLKTTIGEVLKLLQTPSTSFGRRKRRRSKHVKRTKPIKRNRKRRSMKKV